MKMNIMKMMMKMMLLQARHAVTLETSDSTVDPSNQETLGDQDNRVNLSRRGSSQDAFNACGVRLISYGLLFWATVQVIS